MANNTKTRTELKQYFVKNAIPTEGNFADLIDGQLNQADDGLFKEADQPLGLVAAAGEQRRVLQLFANYPAANPDWVIGLNPKDPRAPDKTVAGLGVADGAGNPRLLLDAEGNLTVAGSLRYSGRLSKLDVQEYHTATVRAADFLLGYSVRRGDPGRALVDGKDTLVLNYGKDWPKAAVQSPLRVEGALDVNLPGATAPWNRLVVNTTNAWGDGNNQYVTIGAGGAAGIMFWNPHVVWQDNRASIRYGRTGGAAGKTWWDAGVRADGAFSFVGYDDASVGETLTIDKTGDVSVRGNLRVQGARIENANGYGLMEANRDDWLRINIGKQLPAIALHMPVAVGSGGLSVGDWTKMPTGELRVTGSATIAKGAVIHGIGIGTQTHGATKYPYETIQLKPGHNLRIWYGTKERFTFGKSGDLTIRFDKGYWVFQTDGNLVKYNSSGKALWSLNGVSGNWHW